MVMKAVVVQDGTELCAVGFFWQEHCCFGENKISISRQASFLLKSLNCMMKVTISRTKRATSRSNHNLGVALFRLFMTSKFKSK